MLLKLLLGAPVFLFTAPIAQAQSGSGSATMPANLPVKMGLWENTLTTSEGETQKTRSCFTKESFERSITNMPASCTISNQVWTAHSYSSDVACANSSSQSKGHLAMEFLSPETARSTIEITITAQGKIIPLTIKTVSHFVGANCGDITPGQSKPIQ